MCGSSDTHCVPFWQEPGEMIHFTFSKKSKNYTTWPREEAAFTARKTLTCLLLIVPHLWDRRHVHCRLASALSPGLLAPSPLLTPSQPGIPPHHPSSPLPHPAISSFTKLLINPSLLPWHWKGAVFKPVPASSTEFSVVSMGADGWIPFPVPPHWLFYIIFSNNNHSYRNSSSSSFLFVRASRERGGGMAWLSPWPPHLRDGCVCRSPSIKEREERRVVVRSSRVSLTPFFSPGGNSILTTMILTPPNSIQQPPSCPPQPLHPFCFLPILKTPKHPHPRGST